MAAEVRETERTRLDAKAAPTGETGVALPQTSKQAVDIARSSSWGFTNPEIAVTWAQYPDLTSFELGRFLYEARRLGLDPGSGKQIYAVLYNKDKPDKRTLSIQIAIDGYRSIAAKTEKLDGSEDPVFGPEVETTYAERRWDNGQPTGQKVTVKHPEWASVSVWRVGASHPFTATVRWSERVRIERNGLPGQFWIDQPYSQLGIRAESAALRKAFPMEMRGMEMDAGLDAGRPGSIATEAVPAPQPEGPPMPETQLDNLRGEIHALIDDPGITGETRKRMMSLLHTRLDAKGFESTRAAKVDDLPWLDALYLDLRQTHDSQ